MAAYSRIFRSSCDTMEAVRLMKADQQTTIRIIGKYLRESDREALEESFKVHALSMVDYPLVSRTAVKTHTMTL